MARTTEDNMDNMEDFAMWNWITNNLYKIADIGFSHSGDFGYELMWVETFVLLQHVRYLCKCKIL